MPVEESIARNELDVQDSRPRKCIFQDTTFYFVSVCTNANGACSLHGLLGRPINNELYLERAREHAVKLMSQRLETASASDAVLTALWSELAVPAARREMKDEAQEFHSGCFWRHMPESAKTAVITEILERDAAEACMQQLKADLIMQTRKVCCPGNNATVLTEIHSRMMSIYSSTEDYAELQNPCSDYDQLRVKFFLPTIQEARNIVEIISEILDDMTDPADREIFSPIIDVLLQIADTNVRYTRGLPEWFIQAAIPPYIKALGTEGHDYYLSIDELIEIAKAAHTSVVVTQCQGNELQIRGYHLEDDGTSPTFLELTGAKERGHFSRLVDFKTLSAAIKQQHAREEDSASKIKAPTASMVNTRPLVDNDVQC